MNKIPTIEELNFLIKNLYNTSTKFNGNIKIGNIEEAADLVAYLYGFSSWKEYQKLLETETKYNFPEKYYFKNKKFTSLHLQKEDIENNFIDSLPKHQIKKINYSNTESNMLPYEWLIGKRKHEQSKTVEPIGIETDNFIINTSNLKHLNPILKLQIENLINNKQSFFIFGLDDVDLIEDIKQHHLREINSSTLYKIGKNEFRIDPISEAFEHDDLESLFSTSSTGEELDGFIITWLMIIRTLHHDFGYNWNSTSLLNSLNIESLIDILFLLKTKHKLLYQYLSQYLFKQCSVNIEDNNITIAENGQQKHYQQTYVLKEKLEKIDSLYKQGFFSNKSKLTISKLIFNKDCALFLECDEPELRKDYWHLCNLSYLNAHKKYKKTLTKESIDSNLYKVWSIWWRANDKIQEYYVSEFNKLDTHIISAYVFSESDNLSPWFLSFKQILFLRQPSPIVIDAWKNRALSNTNYWENNLFFNQYEILRTLKNDEAYFWKPNLENNPEKLEHYHFIKVNLYLKNIV